MATRVLVTGGAGFIGSHLADALLARGDEVAVVDDLSAGRAGRLPRPAALHELSITDGAALDAVVRDLRPALVFHLAAQIDVRASVAAPAADAVANVVGTVNVLEAARAVGARLVFCSSGGAVYGQDAPIPSLEDVLLQPESPYGIAKQGAEQYIGLYNRLHGTAHAVLRLSNVYGPRQDPSGESGVVPIFCAAILASERPVIFGDGQQTRDYVYVRDAVAALLAAADRGRPGIWNIASGREVSVLELAGVIGAAAGRPVEPVFAAPRPGELLRSALAVGRAERDLGWRPATPLTDGVRAVLAWIEAGAGERAAC
jgi:UDP-glucose 4-epimerase